MVSFTVRMSFAAADRARIAEQLRVLSEATRREPGCVSYIGHFVIPAAGEVETVVIYEQYVDEAAVEHHKSTAHFAEHATGGLYGLMLSRELEHLDAVC